MKTNLRLKRGYFLGRWISHSIAEIFFVDQLLWKNKFDRIVEIGSGFYGMTFIFGLHALRMGADVKTFDVRARPGDAVYHKLKEMLPIQFHRMNVFGDLASDRVKHYMDKGRVLLYCDDGNKIKEFNTFVPSLKPNDVVIAHDERTEIKLKDIQDTVDACGLVPFYEKEIEQLKIEIFCFIKEPQK